MKRNINDELEANEISAEEAERKIADLVPIDEMKIRLKVKKVLKKTFKDKQKTLEKRQKEEIRTIFQKFYPGEEFEEEEILDVNNDALNEDIKARKVKQAKAYEKAKRKLDEETKTLKDQLEAEKESRLAQITAEKEAQLLKDQELEKQRMIELIKHKEKQAKKKFRCT